MSELVLAEISDRIAYITLNRPEKRNALSFEFVNEIKEAFRSAEANELAKVIVIRANGDAFCAGADLAYLQQLQNNSYEENLADSKNLMELFRMIYLSPKVVIAQVNGPAIAGGCGLVTVCDFCFATPVSTFGYTEVKIGFIPAIVMVFLVRRLGGNVARKILLTGDVYDAPDALELGLISHLVDEGVMDDEVKTFASNLCRRASGTSIAMVKQMLSDVSSMPLNEALDYAAGMNAKARSTEDCRNGISSFLNKQKLTW